MNEIRGNVQRWVLEGMPADAAMALVLLLDVAGASRAFYDHGQHHGYQGIGHKGVALRDSLAALDEAYPQPCGSCGGPWNHRAPLTLTPTPEKEDERGDK